VTLHSSLGVRWIAIACLIARGAPGGTPEGIDALKAQNYKAALREFTVAAEAGDSEAQFQLGEMHRRGLGGGVNPRLAQQRYEQADAQGHAAAAAELGILKWKAEEREQALALLHKSARAENLRAMYALLLLTSRDPAVAINDGLLSEYIRKLAEAGQPDAQENYAGRLLLDMRGSVERLAQAETWYRKAAAQGNPRAFHGISVCLARKAARLGGNLDEESLQAVAESLRKGAMLGDFFAQHSLCLGEGKLDPVTTYAWIVVTSDLANSFPLESPITEGGRSEIVTMVQERRAKTRALMIPRLAREGEALAKKFAKEIRANLKKGLPWEDPFD